MHSNMCYVVYMGCKRYIYREICVCVCNMPDNLLYKSEA